VNTRNTLKLTAAAIALAGSVVTHAAGNNPLHPSYYQDKVNAPAIVEEHSAPLVITNPLHPSYFADRAYQSAFVATTGKATDNYVDTHNPLHPLYKRS
jgi:hypothetical protein